MHKRQNNQTGDISTLNGSTLKLVNKFAYQGSRVSSTDTDINTRLVKARTAIDKLSYGSQTWPIKWSAVSSKQRLYWYCYGCTTKWIEKILTAITQECCEQYWTSPGDSTPQSSSYTATYHSSRKLSKLDEHDMWDTAGEVGTSSLVMFCGPLHMDEQRQDIQLNLHTAALCQYRM